MRVLRFAFVIAIMLLGSALREAVADVRPSPTVGRPAGASGPDGGRAPAHDRGA